MTFNPVGNEVLTLGGRSFRVTPLGTIGNAAKIALRIPGGRADVFRLIDTQTGGPFALKVMFPNLRKPSLLRSEPVLAQLKDIPGFEACRQEYFTPRTHPEDLKHYPDLAYANLMPWIDAATWMDVLGGGWEAEINSDLSWELAYQFVVQLQVLSRHRMAHCDISGGNVLVDIKAQTPKVTLIDFDDVYWPGAPPPESSFAPGTKGYRNPKLMNKTSTGQWLELGDLFAAAILIAEMLGWRDERVRAKSSGPAFFAEDDFLGRDQERYKLLHSFLQQLDPGLGALFQKTWLATTFDQCTRLDDWRLGIALARGWTAMPLDRRDVVTLILPKPTPPRPGGPVPRTNEKAPTPPDYRLLWSALFVIGLVLIVIVLWTLFFRS